LVFTGTRWNFLVQERGDSFQRIRAKLHENGDMGYLLPIYGELVFFKVTTVRVK
jgi:hypothetical protein